MERLLPPPFRLGGRGVGGAGAPAILSPFAQLLVAGMTKIIQPGPRSTPHGHGNLREASPGL